MTSSSLSFAMNLFNRDFLLAGGLESSALHPGYLTVGARASGAIKQEAGCSLLMVWTLWITHTFASALNSNHNINVYDYIPNGVNDLCFNFHCYILACSCQET